MDDKQKIADAINKFLRSSPVGAALPPNAFVKAEDIAEYGPDGRVVLRRNITDLDIEVEVKIGAGSATMLRVMFGA